MCQSRSGVESSFCSRERYRIYYVLQVKHPRQQSFHAHAKTHVRNSAIPSKVQVPFIVLLVHAHISYSFYQCLFVIFSCASGRDFTNSWNQHISGHGNLWLVPVGLAIERFDGRWIIKDEKGLTKLVGQSLLFLITQVVTPFRLEPLSLKLLY